MVVDIIPRNDDSLYCASASRLLINIIDSIPIEIACIAASLVCLKGHAVYHLLVAVKKKKK